MKRRSLITGLIGIIAAPAIVSFSSLMSISVQSRSLLTKNSWGSDWNKDGCWMEIAYPTKEGWDFTLKKIAGSDYTVTWDLHA